MLGEGGAATIEPAEELFWACHPPLKHLVLPGGPKSGVCEVGMEANFGEECFNFYGSL